MLQNSSTTLVCRVRARPVLCTLGVGLALSGCVSGGVDEGPSETAPLSATLTVDPADVRAIVPPLAYGMHASLYDNSLHDPALRAQLDDAGISLLRWPGGGYADNYHFATHTMSPWSDGSRGYLANETDFGGFVRALDNVRRAAMITVNYGSNQYDDGPGEPKEAAAWVAYANGDPGDDTPIGVDGTGFDWGTVSDWASLRASAKLSDDDGRNFLRIDRAEPIGIEYWEVGNEVFGNGYYSNGGEEGFELDLHVPYDGTDREGHPDLSPATYGAGVVRYVEAMKAVDPSIKVGAVLISPPTDYRWAPTWNDDVLAASAGVIDFGVVHWYPSDSNLLDASQILPEMFSELRGALERHAGARASEIEITVTEVGPPPNYGDHQASVMGLFAADAYLGFIEQGVTNVDWLELHNGTFLDEDSDRPGRAYYGIQFAHRTAAPGEALVRAESSRPRDLLGHAGVRQDGSLAALLVNTSDHRDIEVSIEAPELTSGALVSSFSSSATRVPELVEPERVEAEEGKLIVTVPPETLALVEFDAP